MPSPPPVNRRPSSFDDNYDVPEEEEVPRNVSVPVYGRFASSPMPPEENYENDEDDFQTRKPPPPTLPPRRLSDRQREKKEKVPSVRAQTMPLPVKSVPPSLPSHPPRSRSRSNDTNTQPDMFLPPTLNPMSVAKMNKLKGLNQNQKMPESNPTFNQKMSGSELFRKRQEMLEKAFGNRN